ncbi:hypothetical protein HY969_01990 [Candidatus Kaiserbacteria bacterium]|nr:hypothetical protein [Candidatus Kaiserbacteria bacterium]
MNTRNIVIGAVIVVIGLGAVWFAMSDYGASLFGEKTRGITYNNADDSLIKLDLIRPGVTVLPHFTVTGQARGTWYFEASFPVEVVAADGRQLAMGIAQAQGEWMTEEFVPFAAQVELTEDYSGAAKLILHKDNPSGEAANDASIELPIEILDIQQ